METWPSMLLLCLCPWWKWPGEFSQFLPLPSKHPNSDSASLGVYDYLLWLLTFDLYCLPPRHLFTAQKPIVQNLINTISKGPSLRWHFLCLSLIKMSPLPLGYTDLHLFGEGRQNKGAGSLKRCTNPEMCRLLDIKQPECNRTFLFRYLDVWCSPCARFKVFKGFMV